MSNPNNFRVSESLNQSLSLGSLRVASQNNSRRGSFDPRSSANVAAGRRASHMPERRRGSIGHDDLSFVASSHLPLDKNDLRHV